MAQPVPLDYPGSAQSRMRNGCRSDLVTRPPDTRHQRAALGPRSNLTSGYERASHGTLRRQALPTRVRARPYLCRRRVSGHQITHERSQAKMVRNLCPERTGIGDRSCCHRWRSALLPITQGGGPRPRSQSRRHHPTPYRAGADERTAPSRRANGGTLDGSHIRLAALSLSRPRGPSEVETEKEDVR
jgi:hypothetical protein